MNNAVMPFLYVGLGGFVGAVLRYLMSVLTAGMSVVIPYGTLLSNALGCFAIGIVMALAADTDAITPGARLFIATGICGGFTTMSSFIYELAEYVRTGELLYGATYFFLTLFASAVLFYAGTVLVTLART